MNLQRKITLMVATGAVALGAGHVVQKRAAERQAAAEHVIVSDVTPVAAGPAMVQSAAPDARADLPPVPVAPVTLSEPVTPAVSDGAPVSIAAAEPPSAAALDPAPAATAITLDQNAANDCPIRLDLLPQPGAMIGLTLLAPCHPDERIVLRHAGVAVTGKTSASGAYFGVLPALKASADVQILFGSGDKAEATIAMPDAESFRRFVVQWQAEDAFQLNGFENGAGYDQPGHISAAHAGTAGQGAFLTLLGDSQTELPLLAEVFTYAPGKDADVVLEAEVTAATCGREILGETLMADGGKVSVADLTLAMPGCDAIGDILVLKNLVQDMKLAAAK